MPCGAGVEMGRKLFVGNLPFSTDERRLEELFAAIGPVDTVNIVRDQMTGRARGFASLGREERRRDVSLAAIGDHRDDPLALPLGAARDLKRGAHVVYSWPEGRPCDEAAVVVYELPPPK